jgi:limonene-1,2-epoxide hydrolase
MYALLNRPFVIIALTFAVCMPSAHAEENAAAKVVHEFLASWDSHDIDKIMAFVSDDCHYENVPSLSGENPVIMGRQKMHEFLAPFFVKDPLIVPFTVHTEITDTIAGGEGVAIQRIDHFEIGNSKFALPVAGLFKVKDGKIVYWIDYFDGAAIAPVTTLMTTLAKH